ncbi:unnamed protein product [Auanema sp. JU1783]|nr:unnamed protein product [Auanema sp. JU1783]
MKIHRHSRIGPSVYMHEKDLQLYVPPKSCREVEEWQCEDKPLIEDELNKQNNLLNYLHNKFSAMSDNPNEETASGQAMLWDVQTAITALKRRLKSVAEPIPSSQSCPLENKPFLEMYEEKQLVAVQSMLRKDIMEERKLVAILLWSFRNNTENDISESETENLNHDIKTKAEEDLKEECQKEESIRLALVEDICRLKMECALLRAKNEMLSHGHTVSTRF